MPKTIYVSPTGSDSSSGAEGRPFLSWQKAIDAAKAGDTIVIQAGTYRASGSDGYGTKIVNKSGTDSAPITIKGAGGMAVLDSSGDKAGWGNYALSMKNSDHWVFENVGFTGATQNSRGAWAVGANLVDSSDNTFRNCAFFDNQGPGLLIGGKSGGNAVIDCKAYDNYDSRAETPGSHADGIGFSYLAAGYSGNRVVRAQVWDNADDGIDLYGSNSSVSITGSRAWHNGFKPGTNQPSGGNGDGFKLGKSASASAEHSVEDSVAFSNKLHGFDSNGAAARLSLTGNEAYDNGFSNYYMDSNVKHYLSGNVSIDPGVRDFVQNVIGSGNSWNQSSASTLMASDEKALAADASAADYFRFDGGDASSDDTRAIRNSTEVRDQDFAVGNGGRGGDPSHGDFPNDMEPFRSADGGRSMEFDSNVADDCYVTQGLADQHILL